MLLIFAPKYLALNLSFASSEQTTETAAGLLFYICSNFEIASVSSSLIKRGWIILDAFFSNYNVAYSSLKRYVNIIDLPPQNSLTRQANVSVIVESPVSDFPPHSESATITVPFVQALDRDFMPMPHDTEQGVHSVTYFQSELTKHYIW